MAEHVLAERHPCPHGTCLPPGTYRCLGCQDNGTLLLPGPELEPARESFVYVGEDTFIDGIPFGETMKHGDEYRAPGGPLWDGDKRMWREL